MDEVLRRRYERKSAFLDWCDKEGLSVLTGYGVDDLKTAPLKHWERIGITYSGMSRCAPHFLL